MLFTPRVNRTAALACRRYAKRGIPPEGDVDGYAPSGMNVPGKVNRHTMTTSDIDDVIEALQRRLAMPKISASTRLKSPVLTAT